jgi:uncharacterized protein YndB with AHSA1/START domain
MIELQTTLSAPPDLAWEMLTQAAHMRNWWPEAVMEPVKNGGFSAALVAGKTATGTVTAFEPTRRLQLDFRQLDWPKQTRVEIMLRQAGTGARLDLQHSGWDVIRDEATRKKEVDAYTAAWQGILKNFTGYCAKAK